MRKSLMLNTRARTGSDAGLPAATRGTGTQGKALRRMGWGRTTINRAHRRTLSFGCESHVGGHRRRALQGARCLHRKRTESHSTCAGRWLSRGSDGQPRCRWKAALPGTVQRNYTVRWIRLEWLVVAVVRGAQDFCRVARRLPLHGQPHGAGCGDQVRELGGKDRKSTRLNSSHLVISYAVFCLKKNIYYFKR